MPLAILTLALVAAAAAQQCADLIADYNTSQPAVAGIPMPVITYTVTLRDEKCNVEAGTTALVSREGATIVVKAPPTGLTITIACPNTTCTTTLEPKPATQAPAVVILREEQASNTQNTPRPLTPKPSEASITRPQGTGANSIEDLVLYTAVAAATAGVAVEAFSSRKKRKNSLTH